MATAMLAVADDPDLQNSDSASDASSSPVWRCSADSAAAGWIRSTAASWAEAGRMTDKTPVAAVLAGHPAIL